MLLQKLTIPLIFLYFLPVHGISR